MTFGNPEVFAIHFELLEGKTEDYWKCGIFFFIINDKFYPNHTTNWTLNMAIPNLQESLREIKSNEPNELFLMDDLDILIRKVAYSHRTWLATFEHDIVFSESIPIGVELTPTEFVDTDFRLFYGVINEQEECLIFTDDMGKTASRKILKRGTVHKVISLLPDVKII